MEWLKPRRFFIGLATLTALAVTALTLFSVLYGELNQDEGWYLYGARLFHEGQVPWRDFGFSQGPVFLAVYGLLYPLVDAGGILAGRLITVFLALVGFAMAGVLAHLLSPEKFKREGVLLSLMLGALGIAECYFMSIPKTYALTALFSVAGMLSLTFGSMPRRKPRVRLAAFLLSGVAIGLAVGTRMSALAFILVPVGFLWFRRESFGKAWLWVGLSFLGTLLLLFLPALIMGGQAFRFWFWSYHTSRFVEGKILLKASFISQVAQYWMLPCAVVVVAGTWHLVDRSRTKPFQLPSSPEDRIRKSILKWIWVGIGGVTLNHLASPFPYPDYQAFVVPLFGVASAVLVLRMLEARMLRDEPLVQFVLGATWLLAMALSFSSTMNRDWFLAGRDLIWWRTKPQGAIAEIRNAGKQLRNLAPRGGTLFTQDAYLAVESGLKLPPGLEMGPFSYNPKLTTDTARKLHLVNRETMVEAIRASDVAAVSGYGFAIEVPQIIPAPMTDRQAFADEVERRFQRMAIVPAFGQGNTTLTLWFRR